MASMVPCVVVHGMIPVGGRIQQQGTAVRGTSRDHKKRVVVLAQRSMLLSNVVLFLSEFIKIFKHSNSEEPACVKKCQKSKTKCQKIKINFCSGEINKKL